MYTHCPHTHMRYWLLILYERRSIKNKLPGDKETYKDRPLHCKRSISASWCCEPFVSGPAALAGRCDGPERLPIILFFSLDRQVRLYIRSGSCQKQQPTWFMAHLVLAALTRRAGTRKDFCGPLRSSIMRPLSSVLSSIPRVYLAYIMYRVSA